MPSLSPSEVHVWRAQQSPAQERDTKLLDVLSPEERRRAERFLIPAARDEFVWRRTTLRRVLARYLACAPADLELVTGRWGKPELADTHGSQVRFNVAHSHELLLLAVSLSREVGVDVEHVRAVPNGLRLARQFFTEREARELARLPEQELERGFFGCWTRKEAYVKATGRGLTTQLRSFSVTLAPRRHVPLTLEDHDDACGGLWDIRELRPAQGYVGALAAEGRDWTVKLFDGSPAGSWRR
jgi:4'-phosphopantetheinyl transferase